MAKGENIFKRKDGRWEARYIKGHDRNNKIQYGFCYGHTYREAKEKVIQAKIQLYKSDAERQRAKSADIQIQELCKQWLEINMNKLKESSRAKYSSMMEKHIIPELGTYYIHEITTECTAEFADDLLSQKHLSVKTVKDVLLLLHSVLIYGYERSNNQMTPIRIIYPKEEHKELRILNPQEQSRLMDYLQKDMDLYKLGVMIAITTGLRVGEICGLKWENISFETHTLSVKTTVQRIKNTDEKLLDKKTIVKIGTPKSDNSIRSIPLTDSVLKYCRKFRCEDEKTFILTGTDSFAEPRILQRKLAGYYKACNIEGAHFHTFRHTFATRCVEVGCDVKTLSEILGHSSTVITMNRYVHPDLNLKRENIRKLEEANFGCAVN